MTDHTYLDIVIIKNPVNGCVEQLPVAMVNAYVPYASDLHLEDAAKVAAIRDDEEATNLILSIVLDERAADYRRVITPPEFSDGAGYDGLSIESPSLR
jgi:hypothetical protein